MNTYTQLYTEYSCMILHSSWLSAAPPDDRRSLSTGSRTPSPFGLASNASASSSPSPSSSSSSCSALETYSRKVFVGGLPPDIDQGQSNPPNSLPYYLGSN